MCGEFKDTLNLRNVFYHSTQNPSPSLFIKVVGASYSTQICNLFLSFYVGVNNIFLKFWEKRGPKVYKTRALKKIFIHRWGKVGRD
jgi:hypothetical protein